MDMWNLIEATSTEFFYDRLEAIGLHRGQPKMLRFLGENDGCRQKDIADRFFLRAASVSGVLNTLEKQGLIERRQNPKSRRETLIYLTDQGKEKLVCSWQSDLVYILGLLFLEQICMTGLAGN